MTMVTGVSRYTVNRLRRLARLSCREMLVVAAVLIIVGEIIFLRIKTPAERLSSQHYALIDAQGCTAGYQNLNSLAECSAAARALGLIHTSQKAQLGGRRYFPYGCYWKQGNDPGVRLYFNPNGNYSTFAVAPRINLLGQPIKVTDRNVVCRYSTSVKPELKDDGDRPLPPPKHSNACIVRMNALALSLCSAKRLAALVAGKEAACDVWLLMDSVALVDAWDMGHQNMTWPPPKDIHAVLKRANINSYFYNTKNLGGFMAVKSVMEFGGNTGASAQSILRFMARDDFTYSHAWLIEDDVFYTGDLGPVIKTTNAILGDVDYAATGYSYPTNATWFPRVRCRVMANKLGLRRKRSAMYQKRLNWSDWKRCNAPPPWTCCGDIEPEMDWINEQTNWFFARFSKRLAVQMLAMLTEKTIYAHHEMYPRRACSLLTSPACTPVDLRTMASGDFVRFHPSFAAGGSWGVFLHKNSTDPVYKLGRGGAGWNPGENVGGGDGPVVVEPGRLYHPVKCPADLDLGDRALQYATQ